MSSFQVFRQPDEIPDEIPDQEITDIIGKRCDNCVFWYEGFCTHYNQATFSDGTCEYHKLRKILPSN